MLQYHLQQALFSARDPWTFCCCFRDIQHIEKKEYASNDQSPNALWNACKLPLDTMRTGEVDGTKEWDSETQAVSLRGDLWSLLNHDTKQSYFVRHDYLFLWLSLLI
jgi:hypothetical protein